MMLTASLLSWKHKAAISLAGFTCVRRTASMRSTEFIGWAEHRASFDTQHEAAASP